MKTHCGAIAAAILTAVLTSVHADTLPTGISFTRQAVSRMVLDDAQAIPLAVLDPAAVVGLGIMHPVTRHGGQPADVRCEDGLLKIESAEAAATSLWFGGFNPFATYTVDVASVEGSADVGLEFRHANGGERIVITAECRDGRTQGVRWSLEKGGAGLLEGRSEMKPEQLPATPFRLTVQMVAAGFNVFVQSDGLPLLVGRAEVAGHLDLREKPVMRSMSSNLLVKSSGASKVAVKRCAGALMPGIGQADIRAITDESGAPMLDNGRFWFTASIRGGGLQHSLQGVFSLDPGVFDPRLEGVIVFDRGDGMLRNEIASHLFFDRNAKEWRGWTTAFSVYGDPDKKNRKEILAVRCTKDPRHGFTVMKSAPIGLVGDYEDPQTVFDPGTGKWSMLLCQNVGGYKATVFESDRWDGGFKRIAGPVDNDSTGTTLQTIGGKRYALFGSADRKFHVCSFPGLKPLGELKLDLPPWDENSGGRVWPCLIPLPDGYPSRYLMLTFDRFNYPDMRGANWTYGAMYLYHGNDAD